MLHFAATLIALAVNASAWTLNDVSILLPLPSTSEEAKELIGASELLPLEVYQALPRLIMGANPDLIYNQQLKVVAIRIDPCFRETGGPTQCRRQIRMVWQPVLHGGYGVLTADAAMHTFFDLSETEWSSLLHDLTPLTGSEENESLGVHPRILSEGLKGAHWRNLKRILLKYASKHSLTRATAMNVHPLGSAWTFTGVDIKNGVMTRSMIPRAHHTVQGVVVDVGNLNELRIGFRPMPDGAAWETLLTDSVTAESRMGREGIREALEQALRIENPRLEDTGTMDCASCHVAQTVRLWGVRRVPEWNWRSSEWLYAEPKGLLADLRNNSVNPGFVNRLRAFGYFFGDPTISQRVVNESAEVLHAIRAGAEQNCEQKLNGGKK
ncbi:MAG: hypothetical protein KF799_11185 [Bdellovibrionales bacterium]|nr:hypothetical protein [Bdellovibrionales bacterium]